MPAARSRTPARVVRLMLEAEIFVKADCNLPTLSAQLADALAASLRSCTLSLDGYEVDVEANDDRPPSDVDDADAFLFFPYVLEVHWLDRDGPREARVRAVTRILEALDDLGAEYVAAADYEDELPRLGRSAANR